MQEPRLKESALLMEKSVLGEKAPGADTGGMKMIYSKLNELKEETLKEMKDDLGYMTELRSSCVKSIGKASGMITFASSVQKQNDAQIMLDASAIVQNKADFDTSVGFSSRVQPELMELIRERAESIVVSTERLDERQKGLDVLTQVLAKDFMMQVQPC